MLAFQCWRLERQETEVLPQRHQISSLYDTPALRDRVLKRLQLMSVRLVR